MAETTIRIQGMTCGGCVNSVTRALKHVAGVEDARVSLETKEARVDFDETKTSISQLKEAVAEAGYEVVA